MSIILLHVCDTLFILQRISISNTLYILFRECSVVVFVRYCALLDCESFIYIDFIHLFFIHVWHPRFPWMEQRSTWRLDLTWLKIYNRQNPNTKTTTTTTSDVTTRPHGYVQQHHGCTVATGPRDVFNTPCRCTVATRPRRRVQYTVSMYCGHKTTSTCSLHRVDVLWPQDHVDVFSTPCGCTVCLIHHGCTVATRPRRRVQYTVWMYCGR